MDYWERLFVQPVRRPGAHHRRQNVGHRPDPRVAAQSEPDDVQFLRLQVWPAVRARSLRAFPSRDVRRWPRVRFRLQHQPRLHHQKRSAGRLCAVRPDLSGPVDRKPADALRPGQPGRHRHLEPGQRAYLVDSTHRDIHPNPYTYDELLSVDTQYAEAIKQADPTALVGGPVGDNWASLWYSKKDIVSGQNSGGGWWSNPVDRNAHGGTPLLAWYLQQFNQYEQQHGQRLLDYVDMHAYLAPAALNDADSSGNTPPESAAVQALRLESTRQFWDPTYVVSGDYWIVDTANNGAPVAPYYIPRVQGLDLATLWGPPKPTDPGAFAFQMYRNYDGIGGAFGETSVQASSADQSQLAVYAAVRSDLNLTAVVINKTGSGLTSTLSLANFQPGQTAQVWQYSGANLGAIVAQPNIGVSGNSVTATLPANSITMLGNPASQPACAEAGGRGGDQCGLLRDGRRAWPDGDRLGIGHGTHGARPARVGFERPGEQHRRWRACAVRRRACADRLCVGHADCGGDAVLRH